MVSQGRRRTPRSVAWTTTLFHPGPWKLRLPGLPHKWHGVLPCLPWPAHGVLCPLFAATPRELNHPLHQVLDHVEVPFSRLNFSSGQFLNRPYLGVQRLAMALSRLDTATVKCPSQPILDDVNVHVQLLILLAGSLQQPAVEQLVLVCGIHDSPHLLVLESRVSKCHPHLDNCGDEGSTQASRIAYGRRGRTPNISAFKNFVEICGSMDYGYNPPRIFSNLLCGLSNPPHG
jgi:hypothetical protein